MHSGRLLCRAPSRKPACATAGAGFKGKGWPPRDLAESPTSGRARHVDLTVALITLDRLQVPNSTGRDSAWCPRSWARQIAFPAAAHSCCRGTATGARQLSPAAEHVLARALGRDGPRPWARSRLLRCKKLEDLRHMARHAAPTAIGLCRSASRSALGMIS
jgi:hypothetical protein